MKKLKKMVHAVTAVGLLISLMACNAPPSPSNAIIARTIKPGLTTVPIPAGNWVELHSEVSGASGANSGQAVTVVLGLIKENVLHGMAAIITDKTYDPNGWRSSSSSCEGTVANPDFVYFRDGSSKAGDGCAKVEKFTLYGANSASSEFARAMHAAAQPYGGIPSSVIRASIYVAQDSHIIDYRVFFFHERDGVPGTNWRQNALDTQQKAYLEKIVSWVQRWRPAVANGTRNQL